jgi:hypothetical protein
MIAFLIVLGVLLVGAGFVLFAGRYQVPDGEIGIEYSRFGQLRGLRPPGSGRTIGAARASIGGPGWQAAVISDHGLHFRVPFLTRIDFKPQTYVPPETIGLVVAHAGKVAAAGTKLAPFVECEYFQDGEAFLREGGQRGRQLQVLAEGHYAINPRMFDVITINNLADHPGLGLTEQDLRLVEIAVGETGVVITHAGRPAFTGAPAPGGQEAAVGRYVPDHEAFQLPWVFLKNEGQLGVQSETLPEGGKYAINPWFADVVKVPTRNLILEWTGTKADKSSTNLDVSLEEIELDVEGHKVQLDMKQILFIPAQAAPELVRLFGEQVRRDRDNDRHPVQEFVEKQLAPTVAGYFQGISAHYKIQEFITKYDELGRELAMEVRHALAPNGIKAVATMLGRYDVSPDDYNELRRATAIKNHKINLLNAELANSKVAADIERIQIELEAERRRLNLVEIQGLIDKLGPRQLAAERLIAELAKAQVPHTIVSGGNDELANSLLQAIPFNQASELLHSLVGESGRYLAPSEPQQAIGSAGAD